MMRKVLTISIILSLLISTFLPVIKATAEAEWMVIPPSYTEKYDDDGDGYQDSHKVQIDASTHHYDEWITVHAIGRMYDRYDDTPLTPEIQVDWQISAPGGVNKLEWSPEMHFNIPEGYEPKEGFPYVRIKTLIRLYDDEWNLEQNGDYEYGPWEIRHNLYPPAPPNQEPVLTNGYVDPDPGYTSETFSYYVHYSDPDGDPPTQKEVCIDGSSWHQMGLYSGSDSNGWYRYQTTLSEGTHDFFFKFSDGEFVVYDPSLGSPPHSGPTVWKTNDLDIAPKLQHKDTGMLCLEGDPLTGDHAWDSEHVSTGCDHCDSYCVRASISMINSYYGGDLSQDRISFYVFHERSNNLNPESDLGHGQGFSYFETKDALSWALNGATGIFHAYGKPTFEQIKSAIDSGRPVLRVHSTGPDVWHATVIDGYDDGANPSLHVIDPFYCDETTESYSDLSFAYVMIPPAGATARSDEPSLSLDADGDGVIDFDENNRFETYPNKADSDSDLVPDKEEIISYTFRADGSFDSGDSREADSDNDGLRCELDSDSDNGGVMDGLEDLNRNGKVDPGETDPLDPSDDPANLRLAAYSPVNLLVTDPIGRRVGYDPETQSVVNEIPNAIYSGPSTEPQEICILNPLQGTYIVQAIGTETGSFIITMQSAVNGSILDNDTWNGTATPDGQYSENVSLEPDGRLVLAHDIEVRNLLPSKTIVGQNYSVIINVPIENQGNNTETFNVTVDANTTIIATKTNITLPSGNNTILTFVCNTTGIPYGNYTIGANATPVPGEVDTADNTLTGGWIIVTIPGDTTGDHLVDIFDALTLAGAFGKPAGESGYNPNADIDGNNIIDIFDALTLAGNYGETV